MRTVHARFLLVALGAAVFTAGAIAGCGGDDSNGETDDGGLADTSVGDGGGGGEGGQQDSGPGTHADANDLSVYLGQIAKLDGSASVPPGATFAWTFQSVPQGSAITTASLLNADSAKPSFTPDVIGDYALQLTVNANGATDAKTVAVHAVAAKTFYLDYLGSYADGGSIDGGPILTFNVVPTVGAATPTPVACPVQGQASSAPAYGIYGGGLSSADQWEGPAGTEARALVLAPSELADGGVSMALLAVTSATACTGANQPKVLDSVNQGVPIIGNLVSAPALARFSPDGNRVLYVKAVAGASGTSATIATIGFDGTNPHAQIVAFNTYADGGAQDDAGLLVTGKIGPRWAPGGKIALADAIGSGRFQIRLVDDANGATPTLAMGCTGVIQHFDALANGDYLVNGQVTLADGGTSPAADLYVLHPNALTKECEIVRNLTNLAPTSGSAVTGFTLSPDGARVAYVAADSNVDAGAGQDQFGLYVAAVDGTTPPARVSGVPFGAGGGISGYHRAPRWVAGGATLSFELQNAAFDAGAGSNPAFSSMVVAPSGGGGFRPVALGDGPNHIITSLTSCSISHGSGSALMAFGSLAAFLGLVVRRRRNH